MLRKRRAGAGGTTGAAVAVTAILSFALSAAMVAMPLIALRAGYSGPEIGMLAALAAISQIAVRMVLARAMRRWGEWTLIAASTVVLTISNELIALSTSLIPFVLAHLLQGLARACFWTGVQTHVVRVDHSAVSALARMNLTSAGASLGGPLAIGVLLEHGTVLAMTVIAGISLAALIPALMLHRLPAFLILEDRPPGHMWRRRGVSTGCWAGFGAGTWRAMLSSYIPIALERAGYFSRTIGVLIAIANLTSMIGSAAMARLRPRQNSLALIIGFLLAGLGTSIFALLMKDFALAAVTLGLSGLGAGVLQTVGPAVAVMAVDPQERGEAMAATGTFRGIAMFVAPLAVAGLVTLAPLGLAIASTGILIAIPAAYVRRLAPLMHAPPQDPPTLPPDRGGY